MKRDYEVAATRTTIYRVRAHDEAEAIDLMIAGSGREVDGITHSLNARPAPDELPDEPPRRIFGVPVKPLSRVARELPAGWRIINTSAQE